MGCHFIFQGIFQTQGSNSGLLHCRQILCCLSHLAIPSSSLFSKSLPRRDTGHSGIYKEEWVIIVDPTPQAGKHKWPCLWLSTGSCHSTITVGEGAGWPSQNRAGSSSVYKKLRSLAALWRVTWGSAGVTRMDRVGSGTRQVLGPRQWTCRNLSFKRLAKNWGGQICPSGILQEDAQDRPPSDALPSGKMHIGSGPGGF